MISNQSHGLHRLRHPLRGHLHRSTRVNETKNKKKPNKIMHVNEPHRVVAQQRVDHQVVCLLHQM